MTREETGKLGSVRMYGMMGGIPDHGLVEDFLLGFMDRLYR
jgi:hypothetical protein